MEENDDETGEMIFQEDTNLAIALSLEELRPPTQIPPTTNTTTTTSTTTTKLQIHHISPHAKGGLPDFRTTKTTHGTVAATGSTGIDWINGIPWQFVLPFVMHPEDLFCVSHTCRKFRTMVMEATRNGLTDLSKKKKKNNKSGADLHGEDNPDGIVMCFTCLMTNYESTVRGFVGAILDHPHTPSVAPKRYWMDQNRAYPAYTNLVVSSVGDFSPKEIIDNSFPLLSRFYPDIEIRVPELATALVMAAKHVRKLNERILFLHTALETRLVEFRLPTESDDDEGNQAENERRIVAAGEIFEIMDGITDIVLDKSQTLFHVKHRLIPIIEESNSRIEEGIPFDSMQWSIAWRDVQLRNMVKHPNKMTSVYKNKVPPHETTTEMTGWRKWFSKINQEIASRITTDIGDDGQISLRTFAIDYDGNKRLALPERFGRTNKKRKTSTVIAKIDETVKDNVVNTTTTTTTTGVTTLPWNLQIIE